MGAESVHVLVCTSDLDFSEIVGNALGTEFELRPERRFSPGSLRDHKNWCDIILLDVRTRGAEGGGCGADRLCLLDEIRQLDAMIPVIAMLDDGDGDSIRNVFGKGVYDTISCPPNVAELRLVLRRAFRFVQTERELEQLRAKENPRTVSGNMVVFSEQMQQVMQFTRKIAGCDVSVLVTGETGTGKEMLAREIHRLSPRANLSFVAFSCANLPETLIEDELFGHEKGAFTGATWARRGRLEMADQGTLFLDEIGDLDLALQAKLLRVLQERSFERLGSNKPVKVDFRLVCATHRNLEEMVEQGKFRADLYYRLNVVQVRLPALRERREGVSALSYYFLERFTRQFNRGTRRFSPAALRALEEYKWPGNIRELENVVQRAVALADGTTVEVWHLPDALGSGFREEYSEGEPSASAPRSYEDEIREFKRRLILRTLQECGGNKVESARVLGIARGYLHRLINQLEIEEAEQETQSLTKDVAEERVM